MNPIRATVIFVVWEAIWSIMYFTLSEPVITVIQAIGNVAVNASSSYYSAIHERLIWAFDAICIILIIGGVIWYIAMLQRRENEPYFREVRSNEDFRFD